MVEVIPNWRPILVHFSVALLSVAVLLSLAVLFVGSDSLKAQWQTVAQWNLWLGVGFVIVTVLSGVYAYNTVAHDTPSHIAMTEHRNVALVTAILFLVLAVWSIKRARAGLATGSALASALLVGLVLLGATAWLGGELVYRHGLGVMALPKAENHDHSHEGGEAHSHDTSSSMNDSHEDADHHAHEAQAEDGTVANHDHDESHSEELTTVDKPPTSHIHDDGHVHEH